MEERGMRLRKRSKYERKETKLMTCNCSINVEIIYRNITTFSVKSSSAASFSSRVSGTAHVDLSSLSHSTEQLVPVLMLFECAMFSCLHDIRV